MTTPTPGLPITYPWPPLTEGSATQLAQGTAAALQASWDRTQAYKERLVALVEAQGRPGYARRVAARLTEYQDAMDQFLAAVEQAGLDLGDVVAGRYMAGLSTAQAVVGITAYSQAHVSAAVLLANDTYADFLRRSQEAGRTSEAFARLIRRTAREGLPHQGTGGVTAAQAGDAWRKQLQDRFGVQAVTYRDGSRHSIEEYTLMASRTKGRVAYNAGSLNGYWQAGVRFVEVFDGAGCGWVDHQDPDVANGTIRTLQDAAAYPIAHPNCRRAFGARPDLTTDEEAADAVPMQDLEPYEAEEARLLQERTQTVRVREAQRARTAARRAARRAATSTVTS